MSDHDARETRLAVDMREVLRTGRFGPVTLGHTRREVAALLGPPDDWSNAADMYARRATVWRYGPIELHFAPDPERDFRLYLIWCDHIPFWESETARRGSVQLRAWVFAGSEPLTAARLRTALTAQSLTYSHHPASPPKTYVDELVLESGVRVGIETVGDDEGPLAEPTVAYLSVAAAV